jgi:RNA polymerase sigma-70 factor (ECF subfamily)
MSATPADAEERALLSRIAAADRLALRKLYFQYHRRLQRFLSAMSRDTALVEEIINDTLLAVWRGASQFRGGSRVSTWIFGIAYRRALKSLALARNRDTPLESSEQIAGGPACYPTNELERSNWISVGLEHLSFEHRMAVELTYFMGLSCEEIAAIAGCPIGTVKTRLHHARHRLREALEHES